jgi:hypothetical protein
MPSLHLRLLGALAALLLVLAGCGDPADEPEEAAETPEDVTGETFDADDMASALELQLADIEPTRVHYLVTSEGAEDEEIVVSWDPPRIAALFEHGRVIRADDRTLFCSDETEEGGPECILIPAAQADALLQSFVPFFATAQQVADQAEMVGAEQTDDRTLAGRNASCYLVLPQEGPIPGEEPAEAEPAELCADDDSGATLYYALTTPDGARHVLEAVEVTGPQEDDFEPTGPVVEQDES